MGDIVNRKVLLLLKFGEKAHLESLKDGQLYFNPIQKFRKDGTSYRGDAMEGAIPIDPSKISIINSGQQIPSSSFGAKSLLKATGFIQNDDNTFMFCTAIINDNILVQSHLNPKARSFSNEFKKSISSFGDYVLLFSEYEVIDRLNIALNISQNRMKFIAGTICYRDLSDFSEKSDYFRSYSKGNPRYDHYFVKDSSYCHQNEWRIILDADKGHLSPNNGEAYSLDIGAFSWAHVYETEWFLKNFQIVD